MEWSFISSKLITIFKLRRLITCDILMVGGSGLVVCTLAFYSDAQSSNPAEAMYRFNSVKCLKEVKFKNFRRMKGHFQKMFYLEVWHHRSNMFHIFCICPMPYFLHWNQCDQIGRFIGLWASFKAFGNN